MKSLLGDEFPEFLKYYDRPEHRGLRVNTLKCSPERLAQLLGIELEPTPFCKRKIYPRRRTGTGKQSAASLRRVLYPGAVGDLGC